MASVLYINLHLEPPIYNGLNIDGVPDLIYTDEAIKFPAVDSFTHIKEALLINAYLKDSYQGKHKASVTISTIKSSADCMSVFLSWLEKNNISWLDELIKNEKEKEETAIFLYRDTLLSKLKDHKISYSSATLYLHTVKMFYEWAMANQYIKSVPFKYDTAKLTIKENNKTKYAINILTTDLKISNEFKNRQPEKKLTHYNKEELNELYNSQALRKDINKLCVLLAHKYGCRSCEIPTISSHQIVDPQLHCGDKFKVQVRGKFKKERDIYVHKSLMAKLWNYLNSKERISRGIKWASTNDASAISPLFINHSGKVLGSSFGSKIIDKVRRTKKNNNRLQRTFHDLRATFAHELYEELKNNKSSKEKIETILTAALGHESFRTTLIYLRSTIEKEDEKIRNEWIKKLNKIL